MLLLYGNAWQGDYLRYATDFGILEGQALALVRGDGEVALYLDSAARSGPRRARLPRHRDRASRPTWSREVDAALDRMRNQRIGAAPQRLLPRWLADRAARASSSTTAPRFVDRLLMHKIATEIAAMRRAARLADEATRCSCRRRAPAAPSTNWSPTSRRSSAPTASPTISRSSASAATRCAA